LNQKKIMMMMMMRRRRRRRRDKQSQGQRLQRGKGGKRLGRRPHGRGGRAE